VGGNALFLYFPILVLSIWSKISPHPLESVTLMDSFNTTIGSYVQPSALRADPLSYHAFGVVESLHKVYNISRITINNRKEVKNMAEDFEAQLKKLDEDMKTAKTQADKDAIKKRQDELKRKLEESKKK